MYINISINLTEEEFIIELKKRFGPYLGKVKLEGERKLYPLNFAFAKRLYKSRALLIGDAAHSIHPVAGQGLNLGIRDVESVIKHTVAAKASGVDVGSSYLLKSFRLFDTFTKRELLTQSVVFSAKYWRKIGHLVSNVIHDRLIGEKGHFNTKITYIAEEKESNYKSVRKIAVMNQDGSNIKYLTNGDRFVSTPRFSPNGKGIVYIS